MERHYDAFISYRHAPLDLKVAADIQSSLERFPIPKALQKSHSKKRIGPIFRDKEELPTSSDLNDDIERALKNSDYLIVICSTRTAESIWVQREIETFLRDHDRQRVLTVLADGEPQDVIPDILCHEEVEVRDPDGTVHTETRNMEPLSCDYRGKRGAARREELPRLAAAILGCPYDELRQRQRRRRIRQAVCGLSAALLLVSGIAAFAINRAVVIARQAEQIAEQYRNTLINQSRYLAEKSGELLEQGDRMGAIQVALAALPASEQDDARPLVTEALYALNNAVYPYHLAQMDEFLPKCMLKIDGKGRCRYDRNFEQRFSPSGTRWMVQDDTGQLYLFDLNRDSRIAVLAPRDVAPENLGDTFLSADFVSEDQVVLYLGNGAVCWDIQANRAVWTTEYAPIYKPEDVIHYDAFQYADTLVDAEHQALIAAFVADDEELSVYRFDAATGAVRTAISNTELPEMILYGYNCHLALSPDGTRAAVGLDSVNRRATDEDPSTALLMLADLEAGTYQTVGPQYDDVASLMFLPDGQVCLFTTDTTIADYLHCTFPYAVEMYNFEDASLVWSTEGEAAVDREVGEEASPTSSMQFWHRKLSDGGTQDLIMAQFGGLLLMLNPADGLTIRTASFSADILDATPYDSGRIFLALGNGKIMLYLPVSQVYSEMGRIAGQLRNAGFSAALEEYLLGVDQTKNIVVMSNQLEAAGGTAVDVNLAGAMYSVQDGREYRILRETLADGDSETADQQRLLFYRPLSDTPLAAADPEARIRSLKMCFTDEGEDICYYVTEDDSDYTICGWGMESNQKVFSYNVDLSSLEILGFPEGDILYRSGSPVQIRRLHPESKAEQVIEAGEAMYASDLSPDGKYAAVLTHEYGEDLAKLWLLDVEQWTWLEVPAELQKLPVPGLSYSGSVSFSQNSGKLAVWTGTEIVILDLNTQTVSQHVQIPCRNNGYNVFLNDRILLVYGDSGNLTTWNLDTQSVVMEDPYDDITAGSEIFLGDGYFQAGGSHPSVYAYDADGSFARCLTVPNGVVSIAGSEVLSFYDSNGVNTVADTNITAVRVYPLYTLDALVSMANEILDGRALTETEKIQYYIES